MENKMDNLEEKLNCNIGDPISFDDDYYFASSKQESASEEPKAEEAVTEEAALEEAKAEEAKAEEAKAEEAAPEEAAPEEAAPEEAKAEEAGNGLKMSADEASKFAMHTSIVQATYSNIRKDLPSFRSGDTVLVGYRVIEGDRSRVQDFEGVVIKISAGHGLDKTFTVRKISSGVGVERIFPFHSPNIESIRVLKEGKVRRAKLYYLRDLKGKATRIKEKNK